ncbi:MAG: phosphosugar isomerase [Austwickia sp.]|jgi:glucose/mannose-6-phosphate isomerase|nr:phosphosugar isomerase [Austwickia sp.]MBK8435899.1 phosphosugar isomerase [Austwickia sp.]MBK9101585.1 phosphosugar isomerase [Austwickia sp.]
MPVIDERLLDDLDHLRACDSRDTLRALATGGAQLREAVTLAGDAGIERVAGGDRPRSVLVSSLGGSAVVADILEILAEFGSPVPVGVRRNVPLPGWVGALDLVVAVSLSGKAPGPLAVATEAARRGAHLLTVGAEDSPLAAVCAHARGVHVGVGRGRISSRTSLWSQVTPLLIAADVLGLASISRAALLATADRLDEVAEACRPSSEAFVNPAKVMALQLSETVPVVLGDNALSGVAATRAAAMMCRTARMPATHGELPDAASQVVATFDGPFTAGGGAGVGWPAAHRSEIFADPFLDGPAQIGLGLLVMRDAYPVLPSPEEMDLAGLTEGVVQTAYDAGVKVATIQAEAGHPLTRLAEMIAYADFLATYLAIGFSIDPSVSRHITNLRDRTRA